MNIILTGSAGFIGSHLEGAFKLRGDTVLGIDKKININLVDNIALFEYVSKNMPNPDMIIHAGANCTSQGSIEDPRDDFNNNVIATFNICELATKIKAPIIFFSSCKVYGGNKGELIPYGASKLIGETYIETFHATYGIDYINNRFGTVYGPGQHASQESGWLAWFIKCKLENLPLTLYGNGQQVRDVLFIDDVVELIIKQVDNFNLYKNNTYDIGGGKANAISLLDALKFLRYPVSAFEKARIGDADIYIAGNQKGIKGWKPKTVWKDGLMQTLKFYGGGV